MRKPFYLILLFFQLTSCKAALDDSTKLKPLENIVLIRDCIKGDLYLNQNNIYTNIDDLLKTLSENNKKIVTNVTRENNMHDPNYYNYIYEIQIENAKLTVLKSELVDKYFLTSIDIDLSQKNKYRILFPYDNMEEYLSDKTFGNLWTEGQPENENEKTILYFYRLDSGYISDYIELNFNDSGKIVNVQFMYNVD
ncbi:MAG: hypothetical protein LBJ31_04645 [Treponema sp.]|jgi:hypothetical protein|nr:hypothetical protein [Treponema sp.]